jgi:hypothetical protein
MDTLGKLRMALSYALYRSGLIYHLSFIPASPVNVADEKTFNDDC